MKKEHHRLRIIYSPLTVPKNSIVPDGAVVPGSQKYNFNALNQAINASIKGIYKFKQIKKLGNPYDIYNRYIWLISLNLRAYTFDNS